jgi:hypothetical protein
MHNGIRLITQPFHASYYSGNIKIGTVAKCGGKASIKGGDIVSQRLNIKLIKIAFSIGYLGSTAINRGAIRKDSRH